MHAGLASHALINTRYRFKLFLDMIPESGTHDGKTGPWQKLKRRPGMPEKNSTTYY